MMHLENAVFFGKQCLRGSKTTNRKGFPYGMDRSVVARQRYRHSSYRTLLWVPARASSIIAPPFKDSAFSML